MNTKPDCLLEPDILDKCWAKYVQEHSPDNVYLNVHTYLYASRRGTLCQQFEAWLWEQGAQVRQIKGKRYLEFTDSRNATMFSLRWT